ncbi:type II secretion system protein [Sandaracinus amylolyticus]|nr:prepilin-type N-terminal cleavage/methylation domain-containing protein [Sandaracinus amylolyticus]
MRSRKRAARRKRAGMTLVEVMIVVIIMAMIATAVGLAVLPAARDSRERQARADAATMQSAALLYLASGHADRCPTTSDLIEAGVINAPSRARDPWDHELLIECDGDDVRVRSIGADGRPGTEDDIL